MSTIDERHEYERSQHSKRLQLLHEYQELEAKKESLREQINALLTEIKDIERQLTWKNVDIAACRVPYWVHVYKEFKVKRNEKHSEAS